MKYKKGGVCIKKRLNQMKISHKIIFIFFVIMLFFTGILSVAANEVVTSKVKDFALVKANADIQTTMAYIEHKFPGEWNVVGDKLYKGKVLMNENDELVDEISKLTQNDTVTIFLGDTRIATNVMKEGRRAIGTQASEAVVKNVLEKGEIFNSEAEVAGKKYQAAYMPVKNAEGEIIGMWYVGVDQGLLSEITTMLNIIFLLSALVCLVFALLLVLKFTKRLGRRIQLLIDMIKKAQKGEFDNNSNDEVQDEIYDILVELNALIEKLNEDLRLEEQKALHESFKTEQLGNALEKNTLNAKNVAIATEQATQSIHEISSAIEEMSKSIKGVTGNTRMLSQSAQESSSAVQEIAVSIVQATKNVKNASTLSQTMLSDASDGLNLLKKTIHNIEESSSIMRTAHQTILNLGESSKEIDNIVEMIDSIAEQTNLLALNATIEAARAGEHGKGFAVVADEVRKLAERSAQATKEISVLIKKIQKETDQSITSMESGTDKITESSELSQKTGNQISKIVDQIEFINNDLAQLARTSEEQNKGTDMMVEQLSLFEKHTSEITLALNEQSLAIEEVVREAVAITEKTREIASNVEEQVKLSQQATDLAKK